MRKAPRNDRDTSFDKVILVDDRDLQIGVAGKLEAHQRGIRHRAFSIFVCDSRGRFLLQQRALGKYHSGGLWTNTCCSHPRPGETVEKAARRRLPEEMGFACDLTPVFSTRYCAPVSSGLIENELVHVLGGRFDGTPKPNSHEVMAWAWRSPEEIAETIKSNPEVYSVWFRLYWHRYQESLS